MGILTDDMKRVVSEQRLGFAATVCADGTPNLSPKGTTRVWDDDHLVFADLASPQTVANVRANPAIEINVVDPFVRKGYRFKGTATLLEDGELFERIAAIYPGRKIRTLVLVRVERAQPLISPAYERGASEHEIAALWERHYADLAARR